MQNAHQDIATLASKCPLAGEPRKRAYLTGRAKELFAKQHTPNSTFKLGDELEGVYREDGTE